MRFILRLALAAILLSAPHTAAAQSQVLSGDQVTGQPAAAQGTASDGKRVKIPAYMPVRADGSVIDPAGGGSAGVPAATQGGTTSGQNGALTLCAVVTGDQAYTVGTTQPCNLTPTGRLKVGLSSASNVTPAAMPATTLSADLMACRYLATPATWSDGWTGALRCSASGAQVVTLEGAIPAGANAIGSITNTGFAVNAPLPAGTNAIGSITNTGFAVNAALPAGTNIIGNVRIDQTTPGTTNGTANIPNTAAALGIAPATVVNVTSQVAKASAGNLYALNVDNAAVTDTYAIVYNATAAPAAGATLTSTLILWHFVLTSGGSLDKSFPVPVRCSTGCTILYSTSLTTFTAPATAPLASTVMVL